MSRSLIEALDARYRAVSKNNLQAVFEDVHPDFELKTADRVPGAGTYRGAEAATQFFAELVEPFEEVTYEPKRFFARDDRIVVFLVVRFTPAGSSAVVENQVAALWRVRDGQLARCEMFPVRERALKAARMSEQDAVG